MDYFAHKGRIPIFACMQKVISIPLSLFKNSIIGGVRISRIAGMSQSEMELECSQIALDSTDLEIRLEQGLVTMDVTQMDSVLDTSIRLHGFEASVMMLFIPFLNKVQVLWLSEVIEEAHEACFLQLLKRKTLREIDAMPHNCSGPG